MKVFLDTNVILDFYDSNRGHYMPRDTNLSPVTCCPLSPCPLSPTPVTLR